MQTRRSRRNYVSVPDPNRDPFEYGWRMVPRLDADNNQTWEKVPLTEWDVLHPQEDDFHVTSDAHDRDIHYLKDVFTDRTAGRDGWLVLCDHRVEWARAEVGAHGPDVVVFEGLNKAWDPARRTFPVPEMGARPVVVVEVTSPSTRHIDLDEKVQDYFKAGVPLYVIADPRESHTGATVKLLAYRATPEGYARVPDDPNGVWIEPLGVWLRVHGGLIFCTTESGEAILDREEQRDIALARVAAVEKERDAALQNLRDLEAELAKLRGTNTN
jgi:colicin import membrane protein